MSTSLALRSVLFGLTGAFLASQACASVLLTLDISDPTAVKITATGAFPSLANNGFSTGEGVTLVGLLSSAYNGPAEGGALRELSGPGLFAAGLNTGDPSQAYTTYWVGDFATGVGGWGKDVNLLNIDPDRPMQAFTLDGAAFFGEAIANFTGANFVAAGTTGEIWLGYMNDYAPLNLSIGQWQVVPEPSSLLLVVAAAGAGFPLLAARRRRLHQASKAHEA